MSSNFLTPLGCHSERSEESTLSLAGHTRILRSAQNDSRKVGLKRRGGLTGCVLLLSLAIGLLSGCGPRESAVQHGNREQILHRGIGHDLADLDPHLATQASDYHVLSALFEGLVAEDPVDLHPVPGVAEHWEISPDQLTYTFHLRKNAKWSNGDAITTRDFVASWRRVLTASLAAENAPLLYVIQGAEAFHKGQLTDFAQVGVTASDASTLRITLEHPTAYFLSLLTHPAWFPVHVPTISKFGDATQRGNPWAQPDRFVGNGPFALKRWQRGQQIVVEKAASYWDANKVRLQAIHFHTIDSLDAEERAFRAGQLHLTDALPPGKVASYRRDSPQLLRIDPLLATYFYRINVTRPFLSDPRVRRALTLAVDRAAIVEKILQAGQLPAYTLVPPGTAGYTQAAPLQTDFSAARRLLAEAGYPGGKGLPEFELLFNNSEAHKLVAEAVQEMWRRELGVEARLSNQENTSVLEARRTGNFQLVRSNWVGDFVDPASFLDVFRSDSGNNYTLWKNPDYDALLFAAARTPDRAARFELFRKAEALLLEAAPIIPVYHFTHVFLIQPSVKGWHSALLDHHPYKHVWLEN